MEKAPPDWDVCIIVPPVVGRGSALQHIELELWPKERHTLESSAKALRDTRAKIK